MAMFIDDAATLVDDAVCGLCMTRAPATLARIANTNVVVDTAADARKVLLLCGGGAGHEPAHAGYVARGWLAAAVCGNVFASPPTAHVSAAIEHLWHMQQQQQQHADKESAATTATTEAAGILVIVKNYAGDLLNFEFAVQRAREQGIRVASVLAADDVIFGDADVTRRRGLAGCCLLYKILGAAAADGASLQTLVTLAQRVSAQLRSVGASLSACTLPGTRKSGNKNNNNNNNAVTTDSDDDVVEIGRGIHGEEGLLRVPFVDACTLTQQLVCLLLGADEHDATTTNTSTTTTTTTMTSCTDATAALRGHIRAAALPAHSRVVLLVNNLGSTTDLELYTVARHALHALAAAGVCTVAVHAGRHMTSLNAHGVSLTLLRLVDDGDVRYVLDTDALQAPLMTFVAPPHATRGAATTTATTMDNIQELPGPLTALQLAQQEQEQQQEQESQPHRNAAEDVQQQEEATLPRVLQRVLARLCASEQALNALDAAVGDGDMGSGVARAARAAQQLLPHLRWSDATQATQRNFALLAKCVADACAGTSGPLLGVLLLAGGAAAQGVLTSSLSSTTTTTATEAVAALRAAVQHGAQAVQQLGHAQRGDRTMVDVLLALVEDGAASTTTATATTTDGATRHDDNDDDMLTTLRVYSRVARRAADAASLLRAKFGRSRYMDGKEVGKRDPGCELVALVADELAHAYAHVKRTQDE